MAIKTIRVKNFKSFKDVEVHLGNFNVLIGANASGKSNFIHIIEFLRDIQRHGLENAISLQGGPEYLTNLNIGPRENLFVEVVVSGGLAEGGAVIATSRSGDILLEPRESRYSFVVGFPSKRAGFEVLDERLWVNAEFLGMPRRGSSGSAQRHGLGEIVVVRQAKTANVKVTPPEGVSVEEYQVTPWFVRRDVSDRSLFLEHGQSSPLSDIAIYDFDPKLPKKAIPITAKAELEEDGSNLAIVLKKIVEDAADKRNFANLLQDLLPFAVDLDVERFADKSLLFSLREKFAENKPIPASFISDGTINVAALIVALYFERKPIAIFEEPERNVHPHLISRIVGMMKEASARKQVIVTTHNPEVVRNADIADVHLVSRDTEGFSTITKPAEREDVKGFLQSEIGLEELFVHNLLHN
ncbi:MAG: AAA family ATPase [Terriglobia bacterium]|jgi:predicted ATPase